MPFPDIETSFQGLDSNLTLSDIQKLPINLGDRKIIDVIRNMDSLENFHNFPELLILKGSFIQYAEYSDHKILKCFNKAPLEINLLSGKCIFRANIIFDDKITQSEFLSQILVNLFADIDQNLILKNFIKDSTGWPKDNRRQDLPLYKAHLTQPHADSTFTKVGLEYPYIFQHQQFLIKMVANSQLISGNTPLWELFDVGETPYNNLSINMLVEPYLLDNTRQHQLLPAYNFKKYPSPLGATPFVCSETKCTQEDAERLRLR